MKIFFVENSQNAKTGPIPQCYTPSSTCPTTCSHRGNGCYAATGHTGINWRRLDQGLVGVDWEEFLVKIRRLNPLTLWRYGVAGDLPGMGNRLDVEKLLDLVGANRGRRGYAYTHKPLALAKEAETVSKANSQGFTINLSADTLADADRLCNLGVGPVVMSMPEDPKYWPKATPRGRKVVPCPADKKAGITCYTCKLCAIATRKAVIGFPAHGAERKKIEDTFFRG